MNESIKNSASAITMKLLLMACGYYFRLLKRLIFLQFTLGVNASNECKNKLLSPDNGIFIKVRQCQCEEIYCTFCTLYFK